MPFEKGDRVHLHDGTTQVVRRKNQLPRRSRTRERIPIRGFVRAELVDVETGQRETGDWHENTITVAGLGMVVKNFVGIKQGAASNVNNSAGANITDLGLARFWGIGYWTGASATSDLLAASVINGSEWALHSSGGTVRAAVSSGHQALQGTYSLSQTYQYVATDISHAQTVNCLMQHSNSSASHASQGGGSALSFATFASSTKGTTQALNITYNWVFAQ